MPQKEGPEEGQPATNNRTRTYFTKLSALRERDGLLQMVGHKPSLHLTRSYKESMRIELLFRYHINTAGAISLAWIAETCDAEPMTIKATKTVGQRCPSPLQEDRSYL